LKNSKSELEKRLEGMDLASQQKEIIKELEELGKSIKELEKVIDKIESAHG